MPNLNIVTARTEKDQVGDLDEVRASAKAQYPEFRIAKIDDLGDTWEVTLEKPLDKISERIRTSEFPPPKKKDEGLEGEGPEEDSESEEPDGDEDKEGPGDSDGDEGGIPSAPEENPIKGIEHLVKELLHKVKNLEEKAGLVDEIHEKVAPHVTEAGPSLGDLGPTAPGGGNPAGLGGPPKPPMGGPGAGPGGPGGPGGMSGAKPPVPRRPNVPSGRPDNRLRAPQQRGMPSTFGSNKIVFTPIMQNGYEYSLEEATSAIREQYPTYRIASITEERTNNRYVGKLNL